MQNEYKSVDELLQLRGKRWRVYFKMLSRSAKHSGMFVQVPASVESEGVEFSMKRAAIFGAKLGFQRIK